MDLSFGRRKLQLFRALADSVRAGLSPLKAVELLANGSSEPEKSALSDVGRRLAAGQTLGHAMRLHPDVFPTWQAELVAVGEATGRLDRSLQTIAELLEGNREFWLAILPKVAYPVFLIHAAPFILFAPVAFSKDMWAYGRSVGLFLAGIYVPAAAIYFFFRGVLETPALRLRLPLMRGYTTMRYCAYLSGLVKAGVELSKSLDLAASAAGLSLSPAKAGDRRAFAERVAEIGLFDAEDLSRIQVAELSGALDDTLARMSEQAKTTWQASLKTITAVLPAVFLLIVLGIAGYQVINGYRQSLDVLTNIGR